MTRAPARTRAPGAALVLLCALCACGGGEDRAARQRYNEALAALREEAWDKAAQGFLEARDQAGGDDELRAAAAANLALTYARHAERLASGEPEKALGLLQQSAGWFRDAVRLDPEREALRQSLEIVLRRIQLLADQLNRGQNRLEARLDRIIDDERGLRDQLRQLSAAGAEGAAQTAVFEQLSTLQRTLLSEAGALLDLATAERGLIERRKEEERSEADQVRRVQLEALEQYVDRARTSMDDTRRRLRKLEAGAAHDRAEEALTELKRAREQLLEPAAVLGGIAADEAALVSHTALLRQLEGGALRLPGAAGADAGAPAAPPAWLSPAALQARQGGLVDRTSEILARVQAGVQASAAAGAASGGAGDAGAPPQAADPAAQSPEARRDQRLVAAARSALPHIGGAGAAMKQVLAALASRSLEEAQRHELTALQELGAAVERFAGLRQVIELAHTEQEQLVALLSPPGDAPAGAEKTPPLSTAERARLLREGTARNRDRLERLAGLIADELAELTAKAGGPQGAPQGGAPQPGTGTQGAGDQLEAEKQRYAAAERHRAAAATALAAMAGHTAAGRGGPVALTSAREVVKQLDELRRLFFSIVEQLQELLRQQGETHDRTASAQADAADQRGPLLAPLADAQNRHTGKAEALAAALEQQADAAGQAQDPGAAQQDPRAAAQARDAARRFTEAASEVRAAVAAMRSAGEVLNQAREQAAQMSVDLEPALRQQPVTMGHLESAIRILQPPDPQEDQQKQDQQKQDQQKQDQERMSQQQAQRRLQSIRDREAERQKRSRERDQARPDPVEKDW
jgi:hypothetical protein